MLPQVRTLRAWDRTRDRDRKVLSQPTADHPPTEVKEKFNFSFQPDAGPGEIPAANTKTRTGPPGNQGNSRGNNRGNPGASNDQTNRNDER